MKISKLFFILLIFAISACAPEYKKPDTRVQEVYLSQETAKGTSIDNALRLDWWHHFNDPILNKRVSDAQKQNIPIQVAVERIQAARDFQTAIASFRIPSLNVGAGFQATQFSRNSPLLGPLLNFQNPINGSTGLINRENSSVFTGISASWELDLFGRIKKKAEAAGIRAEQAEIFRRGLVIIMTSDVINNYLQLRGAQNRLDIVKKNIDQQNQVMAFIQSNYNAGLISGLELSRAQALLSLTESTQPLLETAEKVHAFRLATLLHRPSQEILELLAEHKELPMLEAVIPVGLPSDLLKRRPDIAIAEREMALTNAEVGAAIAARYPRFFLKAGVGVNAKDITDLFEEASTFYGVGVGVRWNIFDGGLRKALQNISESNFRAAALLYAQAVHKAIGETEAMLVNYGNIQRYAKLVKESDEQAEISLNKVSSLYEAGLINHLAVLTAQQQKNQVSDLEVISRLQTASAVVLLYKSLGGNWEEDAPKFEENKTEWW